MNKNPKGAEAVLHNEVLPFYQKHQIKVENVFTDNGTEFKETDAHPYQIYLELNNIKHRTTKVRRPQTNGFIERFNPTVLDEFFPIKFHEKLYETVDELQIALEQWLDFYHTKRPHQGYRTESQRQLNMGRKSIQTILNSVNKET